MNVTFKSLGSNQQESRCYLAEIRQLPSHMVTEVSTMCNTLGRIDNLSQFLNTTQNILFISGIHRVVQLSQHANTQSEIFLCVAAPMTSRGMVVTPRDREV